METTLETPSKYTCYQCQLTKDGKPWITINFPDNLFHACSYLCYKAASESLPKKHFDLIVNKEDFNEPRPVTVKPRSTPSFKFLTETEIYTLTNEQYRDYKDGIDEQFLLNPVQAEVYHENMRNDAYVRRLEETDYDSDEYIHNDDY